MGQGGRPTKFVEETKKVEANNLLQQVTKEKSVGSLQHAGMKGFNLGDDNLFQFVDAHTESNDLNHGDDSYFTPIHSELKLLNCIDIHCITQHCISICPNTSVIYNHSSKRKLPLSPSPRTKKQFKWQRRDLVPNSGATSHMFTHESDFGDDYKRFKDVFVFIGDNTCVPVHGYGTAQIKLNVKYKYFLNHYTFLV